MLNYTNTNILALHTPPDTDTIRHYSVLYYFEQYNMYYGIKRANSKYAFMVFESLHELIDHFTELDKEAYYIP